MKHNSDLNLKEDLLEVLIDSGPQAMAQIFTSVLEQALLIERERFIGAASYERNPERRAYANGYKSKTIDTLAGTISVKIPKTSDHGDLPFYPQSLERGKRSTRAVMLAIATMYIQGVSTRDVEKIMAEFGLTSLSSTQVSRASKLLDSELEAWRNRPLEQTPYLILDARYEKCRIDGVVRDCALLSAIGVDMEGKRRVLGLSVSLSEAEVHWREFMDSLVKRGLRGVTFVTSDDHAGLKAARTAILGHATWQRCQFHLAQNAIQHAPNLAIRKTIGAELRRVFTARNQSEAQELLDKLVATYQDKAPKLAQWLETNIPEGLAVLTLPENHRKKMRTSNPIERAIQQELKRRTRKIRIFPNEQSLLRLATAIVAEIDDDWATNTKTYIKWGSSDEG